MRSVFYRRFRGQTAGTEPVPVFSEAAYTKPGARKATPPVVGTQERRRCIAALQKRIEFLLVTDIRLTHMPRKDMRIVGQNEKLRIYGFLQLRIRSAFEIGSSDGISEQSIAAEENVAHEDRDSSQRMSRRVKDL